MITPAFVFTIFMLLDALARGLAGTAADVGAADHPRRIRIDAVKAVHRLPCLLPLAIRAYSPHRGEWSLSQILRYLGRVDRIDLAVDLQPRHHWQLADVERVPGCGADGDDTPFERPE
jgi:hypothetical protein